MKGTEIVLRERVAALDYSLKRRHDSYWIHDPRDHSVVLGGRWGTTSDMVEKWAAHHEQYALSQRPPRRADRATVGIKNSTVMFVRPPKAGL